MQAERPLEEILLDRARGALLALTPHIPFLHLHSPPVSTTPHFTGLSLDCCPLIFSLPFLGRCTALSLPFLNRSTAVPLPFTAFPCFFHRLPTTCTRRLHMVDLRLPTARVHGLCGGPGHWCLITIRSLSYSPSIGSVTVLSQSFSLPFLDVSPPFPCRSTALLLPRHHLLATASSLPAGGNHCSLGGSPTDFVVTSTLASQVRSALKRWIGPVRSAYIPSATTRRQHGKLHAWWWWWWW